MANQDYVKRGRSPKKKPKKSTTKAPWKAIIVAILLVLIFGYTLHFLNGTPDPKPKIQNLKPTETSKTIISKKEGEPVIPPPPEQRWSYMDDLPNKEVIVEKNELKVSKIPYIMQCGAYKLRAQAEERKMNIAFQGISSTIRHPEGSSWFKVTLGPYKFKRDAEKDRHKLQRAKIEPCAIWKDQ